MEGIALSREQNLFHKTYCLNNSIHVIVYRPFPGKVFKTGKSKRQDDLRLIQIDFR